MAATLALSIGALSLVGTPPTDTSSLFYDVFTFGFSFLILISVWIRYTRIMSALPLENRRTMSLNIILLFCVSIEPYLFRFLDLRNSVNNLLAGPGSTAYAIDLEMIMLIGSYSNYLLLNLFDDEERSSASEISSIPGIKTSPFNTPETSLPQSNFRMTITDWKIVGLLLRDAERNVNDVAKELKISSRTVKRRLGGNVRRLGNFRHANCKSEEKHWDTLQPHDSKRREHERRGGKRSQA
jgi:hypothetical protein